MKTCPYCGSKYLNAVINITSEIKGARFDQNVIIGNITERTVNYEKIVCADCGKEINKEDLIEYTICAKCSEKIAGNDPIYVTDGGGYILHPKCKEELEKSAPAGYYTFHYYSSLKEYYASRTSY